jgi:predicted short-subunit dehydrogenase-like oxidoreductase (DUF2520 family)
MPAFRLSIIGSGNVAWHLSQALENAGHPVGEVYSKNPQNAKQLISKLYHAKLKNDLDFSESDSQIFILAVTDQAIEEVASEIALPEEAILVHTSGTMPIAKLENAATNNFGVFYPLQTFSKGYKIVDFSSLPICLETSNSFTEKKLIALASSISNKVYILTKQERMILHLSAVFACNFSNHMMSIAKNIMESHKLPFTLLENLITETFQKSINIGPIQSQTGPALRLDLPTLEQHTQLLNDRPDLQQLYHLISQNIIDMHHSGE